MYHLRCSPQDAARSCVLLPLMLVGGDRWPSVLVAVLIERFAYRPLRHAPRLAPLITAIGVSIVLQELVRRLLPGRDARLGRSRSSSPARPRASSAA